MVHNEPCQGLPNGQPCPFKRKGEKDKVCFNHNMKDLCPVCSKAHDDERDGLAPTHLQNPSEKGAIARDPKISTRSQSGQGTNDARNCSCIVDPVLCYVASARESSRKDDLVHLVAAYFSSQLVNDAKATLWNSCPNDVIGDFTRRQNTDKRTGKEAHIQDIYDAMKKLDENKLLPCFVVRYTELHLLPKSKPSELLHYSVTERVSQLEAKLERFSQSVDLVSNQNAIMRNDIDLMRRAAHVRPPLPTVNVQPPDVSITQPRPQDKTPSYSGAAKNGMEKTLTLPSVDRIPAPKSLSDLSSQQAHLSGSWTSLSSAGGPDNFKMPSEQQRRLRRAEDKSARRRPQKVIRGTAASFNTLQGAEPNRDIYVHRLLLTTTEDDVRQFLDQSNIKVIAMHEMNDPNWKTKGYRVTMPASDLDSALGLEWPKNVCVRRWWFAPQKSKS